MCYNLCLLYITRTIAFTGAFIGIIAMTFLMAEIRDNEYGTFAILLGIDSRQFDLSERNHSMKNYIAKRTNSSGTSSTNATDDPQNMLFFVIGNLILSFMEILGNIALYTGTMTMRRWCTVPWFICKFVSLAMQFIGLIFYILYKHVLNPEVVVRGFIYAAFTIISCCIVFKSQDSWPIQDPNFGRWNLGFEDEEDEDD